MERIIILASFFFMAALLLACGTKVVSQEKPVKTETATQETKPLLESASGGWEVEWNKALAEAKNEGKVVISMGGIVPEAREALKKEFMKDYGLEVEMIVGRGTEVVEKILRERRAGLYLSDLYLHGITTMLIIMKPQDILGPIEPLLILPEVKNPSAWYEGRLPFVDKDKFVLAFAAYASASLNVNREMAKDEVKSFRDALQPRWKDKIVLEDPSVPGQGQFWFAVYGGHLLGLDYMRELAKQNPFISRDQRQIVEGLARGKYAIALGGFPDMIVEFQKAGAPIDMLTPREGSYLTSGFGNIGILNNRPHPKAAQVFLNWLLSKKGQDLFNRLMGYQSARADGSLDHLSAFGRNPRQAGEKYFSTTTEEFNLTISEQAKAAREIFGQLLR